MTNELRFQYGRDFEYGSSQRSPPATRCRSQTTSAERASRRLHRLRLRRRRFRHRHAADACSAAPCRMSAASRAPTASPGRTEKTPPRPGSTSTASSTSSTTSTTKPAPTLKIPPPDFAVGLLPRRQLPAGTTGAGTSAYIKHYYQFSQGFGTRSGEIATTDYNGYLTNDWRATPQA